MKSPVRALVYKEVREGRWKYVIVALVLIVLGAVTPPLPESLRRTVVFVKTAVDLVALALAALVGVRPYDGSRFVGRRPVSVGGDAGYRGVGDRFGGGGQRKCEAERYVAALHNGNASCEVTMDNG